MKRPVRATLLTAGLAAALALSAGCGDGPDNPEPTSTRGTSLAGPTPALGGNVVSVLPSHGSTVPRNATTAGDEEYGGICAELVFEGDVQPQWLHMVIDGEAQVTPELIWFVETFDDPEDGKVCYHPEGGLEPGVHSAAILLINPQSLQSAPVERVDWTFEVAE